MKKVILISIVFFSLDFSYGQNILFHEYSSTASSFDIISWNIDTTSYPSYLRETVDQEGRVTKLEFLVDGKFRENSLCYLANLVLYQYEPDRIIEKKFYNEKLKMSMECAAWKTEYCISNGYISKVINHFDMDSIYYSKELISQANKDLEPYKQILATDSINLAVEYYYHSFAKLNGYYPTNKEYKFEEGHYYYDDSPENELIKKGIKNNSSK